MYNHILMRDWGFKKKKDYKDKINIQELKMTLKEDYDALENKNGWDSRIKPSSVLEKQIAGDHYNKYPIQPIEYINANKLNFMEGNIVKLITRHRDKGGIVDIDKLIHYAQLLKEFEYGYIKEEK